MHGDVKQKTYSKGQARAEEIVGYHPTSSGHAEKILILAPHAGSIEHNTGKQAEHLHDEVAFRGVTTWIFRADPDNPDAGNEFGVPTKEITGEMPQFDLLEKYVEHRSFYHGISFHGWSEDYILIGGQYSKEWKTPIAEDLRAVLPGNINVEIATEPGYHTAMSDENILNRLTDNSLQITQPYNARERYWKDIIGVIGMHYTEDE
ncbi:poly-gamma-glutamate hydrolase family protein [Halococcus sediminicola]|uniref:poly-gamma-glutamate hydrolase family protein n=1 Tax=Halococcus sediminicola TaxID=1264579 RepID=UPI000678F14E|nr:poly-gamma-glutamate hydrolase family protein [Halococcus sediminicola]